MFLFAKLDEASASLLTTGDQRSLIALGKAEGLNSFRDQIRGRVVCLESALLLLVQSVGVQSVGEALQRLRGVNTKIDVLFGYKTEFVEDEIVRQLSSYLKDLREKLGDDYPERTSIVECMNALLQNRNNRSHKDIQQARKSS